ncbi:hypothetical protein AXF42_Ash008472 [Apostasia shenzhenica]|uniref:LanC-like protein GCL2 n=1 Tax=Apostasia shenzhenica TaxID=1088818 RepID=A0A2I0AXY7_9ASPA|nr:hypothetical protein AXF42_Ash008472 [Apostasia shenzhenica]
MADRFFPNDMPSFVEETETTVSESSLHRLLSLPFPKTAERLLRAAVDLSETVVKETWVGHRSRVKDPTLYTGALGTAFLLFRKFLLTNNRSDLDLCRDVVKACDSASQGLRRQVTFICGRAGVCALGAVVAKQSADEKLLDYYLRSFEEIKLPAGVPNELLYGRAGYLWACLFLNKHIGEGTIPSTYTAAIVKEIIREGRRFSNKGSCPLMYEWHGKKYWGAAHGLAGIMHVLMDMKLEPEELEDVKGTLRYMIENRFPNGNYPSSEDSKTNRLVHWCHGAPGVALTLVKAAEVFPDEQFLGAAVDAAEVVWSRGLLKRVGICHGVSGNAYVFLSLYRFTGKAEYLYRAKAFSCFLLDRAQPLITAGQMHGGDHPFSLFEGMGGMAHLFLDMINPAGSRFPAYEF